MNETKRPKRPRDLSQLAKALFDESVGEAPPAEPDTRDPHAVALGAKGASKGGKVRAERLAPERRGARAKRTPVIRWSQAENKQPPRQACPSAPSPSPIR